MCGMSGLPLDALLRPALSIYITQGQTFAFTAFNCLAACMPTRLLYNACLHILKYLMNKHELLQIVYLVAA